MNWGLGTKAPVGAKATGMAVWTHDRVDWLRTVVVHQPRLLFPEPLEAAGG